MHEESSSTYTVSQMKPVQQEVGMACAVCDVENARVGVDGVPEQLWMRPAVTAAGGAGREGRSQRLRQ